MILCDTTNAAVEDVGASFVLSCVSEDDFRVEEAAVMLCLALFLFVASREQARLRSFVDFQRAFDEAEAAVLLSGLPFCGGTE